MFTLEKNITYFQFAIIGIQKFAVVVAVKDSEANNSVGIIRYSFQSSHFLIENSVVFE